MAKERTGFAVLPITWAKARLAGTEFQVGICLARYADAVTRECWPSISQMMEDTGLERRTVTRALGRLREVGAIEVVGVTEWRTNRYRLHDEVWAEPINTSAPAAGATIEDPDGIGANLSSPPSADADTPTTSESDRGNAAPPPSGATSPPSTGATLPPSDRGNSGRPEGQDCPLDRGNLVPKSGVELPPGTDHRTDHGTDHEDDGDVAVLRTNLTVVGLVAWLALSRVSRNPAGWAASVRGLGPGGIEAVCTWAVLSQALADMSGNGMEPNVALLRGCITKAKRYLPPPPPSAGGGQLRDIA